MKIKLFSRLLLLQALILSICLSVACNTTTHAKPYFAVQPYVQLGYKYRGDNLTVVWLSDDAKAANLVFEYKTATTWKTADKISKNSVNGHPDLQVFSAEMAGLPPSTKVSYRIKKDGKEIFLSEVRTPPAHGKPVDFAVCGDIGQGTVGEEELAALWQKKAPPMVMITGDIVYPIGTIHFYRENFFPYLNSESLRPRGAPLLRSTLTVGIAGNHDLAEGGMIDARNFNQSPDSLSYYVLWKQPLNGPLQGEGGYTHPVGDKLRIDDFLKAAADAYPRMSNFSFDYGDCHFLVLDGNSFMNWMDPNLRKWVETDLKQSKQTWKFVGFHQPGFNSDFAHREEQRMRHLSDIFERTGVDVVFSGHSHSYQRSYPLHFKEVNAATTDSEAQAGYVYGSFKLDKSYDGQKNCKADGVIYVVSGAGGAHLSPAEMESMPGHWLPFTKKFDSRNHSMTFCHAEGKRLSIEQVDVNGNVIDSFAIEK